MMLLLSVIKFGSAAKRRKVRCPVVAREYRGALVMCQ
jgi:hypothetical protein